VKVTVKRTWALIVLAAALIIALACGASGGSDRSLEEN